MPATLIIDALVATFLPFWIKYILRDKTPANQALSHMAMNTKIAYRKYTDNNKTQPRATPETDGGNNNVNRIELQAIANAAKSELL